MLKKFYCLLYLMLAVVYTGVAQTGTGVIKGKVLDEKKKEGVPFANVIVELNGAQKGGVTTDFDGNFKFSSLTPGKYDLKVSSVGFGPQVLKGVVVSSDKITFLDVKLTESSIQLKEVEIKYQVPLIDKDKTTSGGTVTREEIEKLPTRDINSIAATTAGVFQADEGRALNVRGSRSENTVYFVDGIRIRGTLNLPNAAIEETTVMTGGISAQYGDATGGVISITTRGPSKKYFGGVEFLTSGFGALEPYGYNLAAANVSGPLKLRDKGTAKEKALIGFFLSGEYESQKDPFPSALGLYQVKDSKLKELQANPLVVSPFGGGSRFIPAASFVTKDDLELVKVRPNANNQRMSFAGKVDFQPSNYIGFTVGATYDYNDGRNYSRTYSMFNAENNSKFWNSNFRTYARFRQSFGAKPGEKSTSAIKNAYYALQVDYTNIQSGTEDANAGKDAFAYGYVGKLNQKDTTIFLFEDSVLINGTMNYNVIVQNKDLTKLPIGVTFQPGGINPLLSNYTDFIFANQGNNIFAIDQILQMNGFINGYSPSSVFGIWNNSGAMAGGFSKTHNEMYRLTAQGSADIKGHSLKFGVEYDQRFDRAWGLTANATSNGLWGLARGLTNRHFLNLDDKNPVLIYNSVTNLLDSVKYNPLNDLANQTTFDKNLRTNLGYNPNGTDFIQVFMQDPRAMKLSWFSADELLNNGATFVNYYGFNYDGTKQTGRPDQLSFFDDKKNRTIAPFQPIYLAGYIEDKFDFDDLVFRVGLRVDRFDANQPVLKDQYNLYDTRTAGEARKLGKVVPSNVGDDWVVYVDNFRKGETANVVGYRNGDRWYAANGAEIPNPKDLENSAGGLINPWLTSAGMADYDSNKVSRNSFTSYTPQVNLMPRIAFSFPISDEALFFAHYDVLTQRPTNNLRFDPTDYQYWKLVGGTLNNPTLKPQRTIDYELGFKQKVSANSALTITAYYRELRNMIQLMAINYAFPRNYMTYGNIDFGTVKGMTLAYDLRRTQNVRLNASYTLQFANGTGSTASQAAGILQAGTVDNLRTPIPLNFDNRHRFVTTFDFRYGSGSDYNGPIIAGRKILEDFGFNLVANAISGTPYSRQSIATPDAAFGLTGRTMLKGTMNGSSLPWQFRVNLRVDKDFNFAYGNKDGDKQRNANITVYLQVLNLLNAQNVLSVYSFTGDPRDDGYLTSALGLQQISSISGNGSQQSFIDLYDAAMLNPNNYSLPRRTRLGIRFNF